MNSPETNSLSILERVGRREQNAFAECLNTYGNFIWRLAKQNTDSQAEAETAVSEIFDDIWQYSGRFDAKTACEEKFIYLITLRYLFKKFGTNNTSKPTVNQRGSTILHEILL